MSGIASCVLGIISAALVNNVVLSRFLGLCPFLGVSKNTATAVGMGSALIAVIAAFSFVTFLVNRYILEWLGLGYLRAIGFILIIAPLVPAVGDMLQKKKAPLF